jgi:hypothetical protein
MLSYADIQELGKIALNYECDCSSHSKNDLIQSILLTVGRKEFIENQMKRLTLEDIRFLNSLLFDPRSSFSLEELVARVQQTKFSKEEKENGNPRDMISKFKQRGWLFNGYSHSTKYLFQIPSDLKSRFSEALYKQFKSQIEETGEPSVYRDEQRLILEDIYLFLQYLHQEEGILTAENFLYKRQLQQILGRLSIVEEPVAKGPWRFGYGRMFREYPNRFSLIYDYCYYQGLIQEAEQRLTLTDRGKQRLQERRREDLLEVYRFWLRLYKNAIPNLQSLVHWVERLARRWVTADSLAKVLCPLIKPFYYDSSDSILDIRILQMLMHLGLLRIGEDTSERKVVQISKLGSGVIHGIYVDEEDRVRIEDMRM